MKYIKELIFGIRAKGEKLKTPALIIQERELNSDEFNRWSNEFKFGNKYGTRGSFYQTKL
jgi:hypothetical protein